MPTWRSSDLADFGGPFSPTQALSLRRPATSERCYGGTRDRLEVLTGADKLFLLVVAAAKRFGVKHVVYLSVLGAQFEVGPIAQWHRATEKKLEASGMKWSFLRPTSFMTNALSWAPGLKTHGKVFSPTGDGKSVPVDPRDIAAVAVAALTQPGHDGQAYDLTGPQALSMAEQVAALAKATGKPFQFVDVTPEVARENMLKGGMPAAMADALLQYMAHIKSGQAAAVKYDFEKATGTTPRTFETWAKDHAAAFA